MTVRIEEYSVDGMVFRVSSLEKDRCFDVSVAYPDGRNATYKVAMGSNQFLEMDPLDLSPVYQFIDDERERELNKRKK